MKQAILTLIISSMAVTGIAQVNAAASGTGTPTETGISSKHYRNDISTRALRDFSQRFKDIDDADWVIIRDGYSARFAKDSVRVRADYTNGGQWLATMKYYHEKKLPRRVRTLVKSTYFDYNIDLIIEVENRDKIVYEIHLSDATTLKNIRVSEDEITVVGEYERSR